MQRRTQGNTARVFDADEAIVSELDAGARQAPHEHLSIVEEAAEPIVAHTNVRTSDRMLGWTVGGGLALLTALLAAVLFSAGINVEVLP